MFNEPFALTHDITQSPGFNQRRRLVPRDETKKFIANKIESGGSAVNGLSEIWRASSRTMLDEIGTFEL